MVPLMGDSQMKVISPETTDAANRFSGKPAMAFDLAFNIAPSCRDGAERPIRALVQYRVVNASPASVGHVL